MTQSNRPSNETRIGMADNKQKQIIHILKGQLINKKGEIDEAGYRGLLSRNYDVDSSRDLTYSQATSFIDDLIALGGRIVKNNSRRGEVTSPSEGQGTGRGDLAPTKKRPTGPNITHLMTREQLEKIEMLKKDITWHAGPMGYYAWLMKYLKKDHITTMKEASNVIEALKQMKARQQRQKSIEAQQGHQFHDHASGSGGRYEW